MRDKRPGIEAKSEPDRSDNVAMKIETQPERSQQPGHKAVHEAPAKFVRLLGLTPSIF